MTNDTAPQGAAMPSEPDILALNVGERYFSESPTKYPEAGHGTQYHAGAPGVVAFARAVLARWGATQAGQPLQQRRKDRPVTNDTTPLSEFQENQWWIRELDEITSVRIGGTVPVTPDLQRAVAVVHNLLRVIAEDQPPQQSAPVPLTDEQIQQGAIDCYVNDHLDFQAGVKTAERHHGITHKAEGAQP